MQLPTVTLPGFATVLVCALLCLAAGGRLSCRPDAGSVAGVGRNRGRAGRRDGTSDLGGVWSRSAVPGQQPVRRHAVAGHARWFSAPFAGCLCERSGVVNVSIEGQFLSAAFAAAVVGSLTQSVPAALIAAMLAGLAMAALLAVFSINYLVNQVVLRRRAEPAGRRCHRLPLRSTGAAASSTYNSAPVLEPIAIPGLCERFRSSDGCCSSRTSLAYLAAISVVLVWLVLLPDHLGSADPGDRGTSGGGRHGRHQRRGVSAGRPVLAGGVFGGLGGSFFTLASTGSFTKEFTVGNGFIALAAVIMGRWHPVLASIMCLFFGFVTQMASQLQTLNTPMPSQFSVDLAVRRDDHRRCGAGRSCQTASRRRHPL